MNAGGFDAPRYARPALIATARQFCIHTALADLKHHVGQGPRIIRHAQLPRQRNRCARVW